MTQDRIPTVNNSSWAHDYFDSLADGWSAHYAPGGAMTGRGAQFRGALAERVPPGSPILDFGCGSGEISRVLAEASFSVTAVDTSPTMIATARKADAAGRVRWIEINPDAPLPFGEGTFAAIIASSVLEYVADPAPLLSDWARILSDKGVLAFTVPNPDHPIRRRERLLMKLALNNLFFALIRRTRWEAMYCYLRLSQTRWSWVRWRETLIAAGFDPDAPRNASDPLILITAVRRR